MVRAHPEGEQMRKVIVSNFTSLDGYVAGVGNDVMALPFDPSFDVYNLERIRNADTLLTGRTTYEQLMAFWVPFADDPAASDLQREIGRFNRDIEKVVISDRLLADATLVAGTTVVRRDKAVSHLTTLRQGPGRDILCFGSHLTWNPLLAAGQVDELHLMVGCAGLGNGVPLFTRATPRLQLLDTWRADDADSIVLRYSAR
jgi:dihydrofolate reductase